MRRGAVALVAALFVAGCTSTVILGAVPDGGGGTDFSIAGAHDLAQPVSDGGQIDMIVAVTDFGADLGGLVDLAP